MIGSSLPTLGVPRFNPYTPGGELGAVLFDAAASYLSTPEGARAATQGAGTLLGHLDGVLRGGASADMYGKLLARAADPSTQAAVMKACTKLGVEGAELGKAANSILRGFGKGGLAAAFARALKLSPKVLAIAGKLSSALPIAGLVIGIVMAAKSLSDPYASNAQKGAAVVSLLSGIIGTVLPGTGVVTSVLDIGAGLAADGFDARARSRR